LGSTLAPGQSTAVTIALGQQLPDGPWNAALTLKSGLLEKNSQARIQFPAGPATANPAAPLETLGAYLGVGIGVALLVLLVIVVAVVVMVRRRRPRL
jgi:hypothetical protein